MAKAGTLNMKSIIKIAFVGDIALNNKYIDYYQQGINPFISMKGHLTNHDFVIGNLECIIQGEYGENLLKRPRLSTNSETLSFLKDIKIKVVTLANNHVYDNLEDGYIKTVKLLDAWGISYLGAGLTEEQAEKPLLISKNDIKIGLLNYITDDTNPNLPMVSPVFLNLFNLKKAEQDIERLSNLVDWVIVLMHWGGRVEGGLYPDYDQPNIAKKLIRCGADAVIGHHSHTFQPYEKYRKKYIFYSLGNFCFSDFSFESENYIQPFRRKITTILSSDFWKEDYSISLKFYQNMGNYFRPLSHYSKNVRIQNIIHKFIFINKCHWHIYFFHKQHILPLASFMRRRDIRFKEKCNRISKAVRKRVNRSMR